MLGRPENLDQLFLADFNQKKIYCSQTSLQESKRLEKKANANKEKLQWLQQTIGIKLAALNIRSLNSHYGDLVVDNVMLASDIVAISETFYPASERFVPPQIPGFQEYNIMAGRGNIT